MTLGTLLSFGSHGITQGSAMVDSLCYISLRCLLVPFLFQIVNYFDIAEDATHIAVIVFSEAVELEFGLDT